MLLHPPYFSFIKCDTDIFACVVVCTFALNGKCKQIRGRRAQERRVLSMRTMQEKRRRGVVARLVLHLVIGSMREQLRSVALLFFYRGGGSTCFFLFTWDCRVLDPHRTAVVKVAEEIYSSSEILHSERPRSTVTLPFFSLGDSLPVRAEATPVVGAIAIMSSLPPQSQRRSRTSCT